MAVPTESARVPGSIGLLDDYISDEDLAAEIGCHRRSLRRMELQPDGLPFVVIAGKKFHPIAEVREFIRRRTRYPNPTRRGQK